MKDNIEIYSINSEQLVFNLEKYRDSAKTGTVKNIIQNMIYGIGLHGILSECELLSNNQLVAERSIKKHLLNDFKDSKVVDDIMLNYYRLLFFPMFASAEKKLKKYVEYNEMNFNKANFKVACRSYLNILPHKMVLNFISIPVLLTYFTRANDLGHIAKIIGKIVNQKANFGKIAPHIGLTPEIIDDLIENSLIKSKIGVNKKFIYDSKNKLGITFLNEFEE